MRRLSLAGTGLLLLLGACTTTPNSLTAAPLQVAEEHPGFAGCAAAVQASYPGVQAVDARVTALQQCLARNPGAGQLAMRLS
ncbi:MULTISPECIES: hypothetical protein [unclassified Azospirillum]|uniref:hypothetical protein n=1 Tax=unclassified Azospirillum TaxID=2630922 RepID=UPI000B70E539|nr:MULTISPECIES: hypothetical protein [unclassified Azospirillum]SNS84406.1 hypothetical protein SAMN05880556_11354 [Azospirillum sp. RU38E]SNT01719.1 hypothetical protein SAMN05880591_11353 [Azospirillum sp. RU37A]